MGYTHYYRLTSQPQDAEKRYKSFAAGVAVIINQAADEGVTIADGFGNTQFGWEANSNRVWFNGYGEEAHETFGWLPNQEVDRFEFVKTAYKPYDQVVVASLLLLKKIYAEHVYISSDGGWSDWQLGRDLYYRALNEEPVFPFDAVEAIA